jgi:hypothetical protein
MAVLTSCSILHALGHFCGNIHLRHPFFVRYEPAILRN